MIAIQAPLVRGEAIELTGTGSRIFRKQVLKVGTINYKGQRLDFTPAYLDDLVAAYRHGAYDSVPLVFADAQNRHTQDVERIRGEVTDLARVGDSLTATIRVATPQAAQLLRDHPKLGVSVRIEPDVKRPDGRRGPAVQHVLATANPRITGMTPWEPVELSRGPARTVIDLSNHDFEEQPMTDTHPADTPSGWVRVPDVDPDIQDHWAKNYPHTLARVTEVSADIQRELDAKASRWMPAQQGWNPDGSRALHTGMPAGGYEHPDRAFARPGETDAQRRFRNAVDDATDYDVLVARQHAQEYIRKIFG